MSNNNRIDVTWSETEKAIVFKTTAFSPEGETIGELHGTLPKNIFSEFLKKFDKDEGKGEIEKASKEVLKLMLDNTDQSP